MLLQEPSSSLCDLHHTRCNLPHVPALVANRRYLSADLAVGGPWPRAECVAAPHRVRSVRGLRTASLLQRGPVTRAIRLRAAGPRSGFYRVRCAASVTIL